MSLSDIAFVLALVYLLLVLFGIHDDKLSDTYTFQIVSLAMTIALTLVNAFQINSESAWLIVLTILWGINVLLRLILLMLHIEKDIL